MTRPLLLVLGILAAPTLACQKPDPVDTLPPQPLSDRAGGEPLDFLPMPTLQAEPLVSIWVRPSFQAEPPGAFSLQELETLVFTAELVNGATGSEVVLELEAPGEVPYQRLTAQIDESGRAEFRVPVAGTWIQQAQMSGIWTARFLADGAVPGVQTFELHDRE